MKTTEIRAKSILSSSQVYDYVINPYVGCQHACSYCYARFMKRFSGHKEDWGEFVDVKINAADLLRGEIARKKRGNVWISGVCDPYQPLEERYGLTRRCLEILLQNNWPVIIQTRSPLLLRDLDILKKAENWQAGLSIPSSDDEIRKIFEPKAPPIEDRLRAVAELHRSGVTTYVMIAPILPQAEKLIDLLEGKVDHIVIDRMNYHYADRIYAKQGWKEKRTDRFFRETMKRIVAECAKRGIDCGSACP